MAVCVVKAHEAERIQHLSASEWGYKYGQILRRCYQRVTKVGYKRYVLKNALTPEIAWFAR